MGRAGAMTDKELEETPVVPAELDEGPAASSSTGVIAGDEEEADEA